jgi:hypothetical protein
MACRAKLRRTVAGAIAAGALLALPATALAQAPDTSIDSGPPAFTNSPNASFAFSGTNATSFECKVDSASFAACTSPRNLTSLSEGQHTFQVRGVSGAGGPDPTPASRTWTVDFTAPETNLTGQPLQLTNQTSATFEFSSPDGSAALECSLNGAPFSACSSPVSYIGLSDGTRNFVVRAVDQAGNADVTPPSATWTVDTAPPDTGIAGGPTGPTNVNPPSFDLTAGEPGSTFQCAVDGGPFAACATPFATPALADGSHSLQVRAVDCAGNADASPASRSWVLDTVAPAQPDTAIAPVNVRGSGGRQTPLRTASRAQGLGATARFQTLRTLRVKWSTPGAGVRYDVRYQKIPWGNSSALSKPLLTGTAAKSKQITTSPGYAYCFEVTAVDQVGNRSPTGESCTTMPHRVKDMFRPGCALKSGAGHYFNQFTQGCPLIRMRLGTGDIAAQGLPTPTGIKRVVVVATECPSCGKVKISIGPFFTGTQPEFEGNFDLTSSSTRRRRLIVVKTFSKAQSNVPRRYVVVRRVSGSPQIEGIGFSGE